MTSVRRRLRRLRSTNEPNHPPAVPERSAVVTPSRLTVSQSVDQIVSLADGISDALAETLDQSTHSYARC